MDRNFMDEYRHDRQQASRQLDRIERHLETLVRRRKPLRAAARWLRNQRRLWVGRIRNRCEAASMRMADRFSRQTATWDVFYEHRFRGMHRESESRIRMPAGKYGKMLGTGLCGKGDDVSLRVVIAGVPMERFTEAAVVAHTRYYLLRADRDLIWKRADPESPFAPDLKTTRFEWQAIRDFYILATRLGEVEV